MDVNSSSRAQNVWLDDKHVVFGRVIGDGMLTLRKMKRFHLGANAPKLAVIISQCGEM